MKMKLAHQLAVPDPLFYSERNIRRLQQEYDKARAQVKERFFLYLLKRMEADDMLTARLKEFVATVDRRGFSGTVRTVCLKNLRIFGLPVIVEDHIWLTYDRKWAAIEPFVQGQNVMLVGTGKAYRRLDDSEDYTLDVSRIIKL